MNKLHAVNKILPLLSLLALPCVQQASAAPVTNQVLTITSPWRYTTNNVDAQAWTAPGYGDSAWSGPSNALLYIEGAALPAPKNTPLPTNSVGNPLPCYYFRTSFNLATTNDVARLVVSNLLDDGAVFYLNGQELSRLRMSAGAVTYSTLASSTVGDATAFDTWTASGSVLTNLVAGNNVLAARVHQSASGSTDIVFGMSLGVVTDPNPFPQLLRGPYLQRASSTNIVIRWRTDLPSPSKVLYGTSPGALNLTNEVAASVTEHEVGLDGLLPSTRYYYAIYSGEILSAGGDANFWFVTHPPVGSTQPLRFWAIGDAGTKNASQRAVRDAFYKLNGTTHVDGWLMLGDNAYDTGTDAEHQLAVFDMYPTLLRNFAVWPTLGNHETYSTDPNGKYAHLNIWSLPTNNPSATELYYSFDIGMVHFICLDSMVSSRLPTGPMATWLKADLDATTNRWIIAFFHHPPYTKGSHNSDTESELIQMRSNLLPILEAGGVDLVLSGHSHSYERSFLLNGHYGLSTTLTAAMKVDGGSGRVGGTGPYIKPSHTVGNSISNQGAVYAVAGSSGKTSGGTLDHPAMYISLNVLGSMVLDITTNRLDAIFLRELTVLTNPLITNDWFTILKTNLPPVASNQTATVNADVTTLLTLKGSDVNRDPIVFATAAAPANGLLSELNPATGTVKYTPAHGRTNADTFTFVTNDGKITGTPGTVTVQVTPPADADNDGVPDVWEAAYGVPDAEADTDRDGVKNRNEYWAGTNPTNALSWLRITGINRGQNGYQLAWSSVGATRYRVQFSDGDAQGSFNGVFQPLVRPVGLEMDANPAGSPGTMSFTDDYLLTGGPPANGRRYFRVEVVQ